MKNRRTYLRIPIGVKAQFQLAKERGVVPRPAVAQNISMIGMRLSPVEELPLGQKVSVTLALPHAGKVRLSGVVVWAQLAHRGTREYDVGLRWTALAVADQAKLNAFLTEQRAQAPGGLGSVRSFRSLGIWTWVVLVGLIMFAVLLVLSSGLNF